MSDYQMTTLPNGVRILSEQMAGFSSAALGIWVATGSRAETASESGAAHFIEHMLFKGTSRSTAEEIAQRMDAIGGQINAFTTKECTCFYARALKSHLPEALDILCEMFFDAKFAEKDVQLERGVILEEIGMYQDDPSDLVSERLNAAVYKGSPLARPILGKRSTLEKMTGQWLKDYKNTHYLPGTVIVALAGSFDESILDDIAARFSVMAPGPAKKLKPAVYHPAVTLKKKATEQNHLMLSFPSIRVDSPHRFTMQLLSSILGGGMSSRLFQEIREQRGLCYSIYAAGSCYADTGMFLLYTALNRDTEAQALTAIREVVRRFTEDGVTQEELDRAREQAKASVLMGLEANTAHMNHLARNVLNGTPIQTAEEIIASYDAITREDVRDMAQETFDWSQLGFSAVGRVAAEEQYRELLKM
ncbi:MAG: insulinase family protein [Clostridiales bacterium]|nr:insulinase family protein [Clostridiales bacterium]